MASQRYHVFLVHHEDDDAIAQELAHRLRAERINPWVYNWNLIPGELRQEAIEKALAQCETCAILIGANGIEEWQNEQVRVALDRQATAGAKGFRVIPVLLPHARKTGRDQLPSFLSTKVPVEFHDSLNDDGAFRRLISGILGVPIGPSKSYVTDRALEPYRGLDFFDVADSPFFFGREALIEDLINMLRQPGNQGLETRFIGIVGPSGSGKSSLARAGLIANLNKGSIPSSETWPVVICTPGANPVENLAVKIGGHNGKNHDVTLLLNNIDSMQKHEHTLHLMTQLMLRDAVSSAKLVLLIDQFEEIFTLCSDEKLRTATIDNIVYAATISGGKTIVVIALRADFYGKCAQYQKLGEILSTRHKLVGPMSPDELREAIERPAVHQGALFEAGLVDLLLNDVRDQPGGLPLLQDGLLELWRNRSGLTLTHAAYTGIGGIKGALNQRAEEIHRGFSVEEQSICRQIFLRLVEPGEGSEDTKRPATLQELIPPSGARSVYERVLNKLSGREARLLTIQGISNPVQRVQDRLQDELLSVELSHEALIQSWKRLQGWIHDARSALRVLRRLGEAAREWELSNQSNDLLYRGVRLTELNELVTHSFNLDLSELEQEFLKTSLAEEARANREKQDRILKDQQLVSERRYTARLRIYLFTIAVLFLLSLVAVVLAIEASRSLAQANQKVQAFAYASEAQIEINERPERALILVYAASSSLYDSHSSVFYRALFSVFDNVLIRKILRSHEDVVTAVAWSPDGQQILTGSTDKTARIWDVTTGNVIQIFTGHTNVVTAVAWSPDGQQILTGSSDKTARIWDVATGQLVTEFQGHKYAVRVVAWSPDGQLILTGSDDWTVRIWDHATATTVQTLTGHEDGIRAAAWSLDGHQIVTGSADRTVRIWDSNTGKAVQVISGYLGQVTSVAWSPDGQQILTGSLDKTIRILDSSDNTSVHVITGHQYGVTSVAWSPDGQQILSGSLDNTVRIWDLASGTIVQTFTGYTDGVTSVAWNPHGEQVVGASLDKSIRLWNTVGNAAAHILIQHQQAITTVAWSPNGKRLLTGSLDKSALIWDATKGTLINTLQGHTASITGAAWSPDGQQVITGSRDKTARIWNINTATAVITLTGHSAAIMSTSWSPDGSQVVTGSDDWTARIWDVQKGTTVHILKGHAATVTSVAWSPDGKQVVTASLDKTVRIWDVDTGAEVGELKGAISKVNSVAWSPDGYYIIAGSDDKTAQVWSLADGTLLHTLTGHAASITSVAWSPDGQYMVTGSDDKTARVWNLVDGAEVRILTGHAASITSVAWSPDGQYIATGSIDKNAKLWYADEQFAIASITHQICEVYQNNDQLIEDQLQNWQWQGCNVK